MSWYTYKEGDQIGGSMKEPLLINVTGELGHEIKVDDPIITFTQAGRQTRVELGVFRGVIRMNDSRHSWEHYVVEREGGKRSKLHYPGMVPMMISLFDIAGHCI